ncbi:MAG: IclR family transcriptional regulator, partial [Ktedonobacteraceae bacterium]|nr:IclR family transcriptional regulator [Ktedonobacteraceae bacterium]
MGKRTVQHIRQPGETTLSGNGGNVPSPMVERAFRVLDLLSTSETGMTLSELARAMAISKGSLHGLLKTLETIGVIEQSEERLYAPGPHLYELAQHYAQHAGLRRFAIPAMQRLAQQTGETVFLGRVERECVRIIECAQSEDALHITAQRGTRVHLLAGATGRIVLANWPLAQREEYLRTHSLPAFTPRSLTNPQRFLAAVEETARTGLGKDYEEYLTGVNAVASAIRGPG